MKPCFHILSGLVLILFSGVASAETRGKPFTEEQIFEMSTTMFFGAVVETKTYPDHKRTVPTRARVLLSLKGRVGHPIVCQAHSWCVGFRRVLKKPRWPTLHHQPTTLT